MREKRAYQTVSQRVLPFRRETPYAPCMSTITAILEADADGTLHLPLPSFLQTGKVKITAMLEPAPNEAPSVQENVRMVPKPGSMIGFWMSPDFDEPLEDFAEYM